jgi:hypothetical protein
MKDILNFFPSPVRFARVGVSHWVALSAAIFFKPPRVKTHGNSKKDFHCNR